LSLFVGRVAFTSGVYSSKVSLPIGAAKRLPVVEGGVLDRSRSTTCITGD